MNVQASYINGSYPRQACSARLDDYPGVEVDMDGVYEAIHHASEALVDYDLLKRNPDYMQTWVSEALAALHQVKLQRPAPLNGDASDEF